MGELEVEQNETIIVKYISDLVYAFQFLADARFSPEQLQALREVERAHMKGALTLFITGSGRTNPIFQAVMDLLPKTNEGWVLILSNTTEVLIRLCMVIQKIIMNSGNNYTQI